MENYSAEWYTYVLRCLLHYHERMTMPLKGRVDCRIAVGFEDGYADTLREAIRCIEIVHGLNKPASEQMREACEKAAAKSGKTVEELFAYYEKAAGPEYVRNLRRVLNGEADQ